VDVHMDTVGVVGCPDPFSGTINRATGKLHGRGSCDTKVRVCTRVYACARVCTCARTCARVCACACVYVYLSVLQHNLWDCHGGCLCLSEAVCGVEHRRSNVHLVVVSVSDAAFVTVFAASLFRCPYSPFQVTNPTWPAPHYKPHVVYPTYFTPLD
jgi:hypothetical protein